jgi:hypothetical protein
MFRTMLGSLLALAGAVAAVWSPFRAWYGGRHGSDIRVDDLFTDVGVTPHGAALLGSLFLPMLFAALLTVLGLLLRSRLVVALAGVIVLGFTILWMVRQAQFSHSLTAGGNGLDTGVAFAVLGGLLLIAAAFVLPDRNRQLHYGEPVVPVDRGEPPRDEPPYDTGSYDTAPYDGKPYDDPTARGATRAYDGQHSYDDARSYDDTGAYDDGRPYDDTRSYDRAGRYDEAPPSKPLPPYDPPPPPK